ncbi:MAG: NADH-quinone oxidoreductase subunit C [Actinomycetota bacterium]
MSAAQRVEAEEALDRVRDALGERVREVRLERDQVHVHCDKDHLVEVMTVLRDAPELRCRFFTFLSAIDWTAFEGRAEEGLELLVHVYSPEHVVHVSVRVPLGAPDGDLSCPSISAIYKGALWAEREMFDMFGIAFPGHPKLVGIYLPEDFEGHPLLKSFKLPSRALVKDWPGAKDPDEAAAGGR